MLCIRIQNRSLPSSRSHWGNRLETEVNLTAMVGGSCSIGRSTQVQRAADLLCSPVFTQATVHGEQPTHIAPCGYSPASNSCPQTFMVLSTLQNCKTNHALPVSESQKGERERREEKWKEQQKTSWLDHGLTETELPQTPTIERTAKATNTLGI